MSIIPIVFRYLVFSLFCTFYAVSGFSVTAFVKDIAVFEGNRENVLQGKGEIVGLNGSGDSPASPYTKSNMRSFIGTDSANSKQNIGATGRSTAEVVVAVSLPPYFRSGMQVNASVHAYNGAYSLDKGFLMPTTICSSNGKVCVQAQGTVIGSGIQASAGSASFTRNNPASGHIEGGAIIEQDMPYSLTSAGVLKIFLKIPNATTAKRIAEAINKAIRSNIAQVLDPGAVSIKVPTNKTVIDIISMVENLKVEVEQPNRVVIDSQRGVIVIGNKATINKVAVICGGIQVKVSNSLSVLQPGIANFGDPTIISDNTDIDVNLEGKAGQVIEASTTIDELMDSLNKLRVPARTVISILMGIKKAGALNAELVVL